MIEELKTNLDYIEPSGNDLINKELEALENGPIKEKRLIESIIMMKYIRTIDAYGKEIIALFDNRPVEKGGNVLQFGQKNILLRKGIVIKRKDFDNSKQADTIEELCDELICVLKNGEHNRVMFSTAKEYAKGNMEVYGAIWTDKGLIYVAKMNDKGELELL